MSKKRHSHGARNTIDPGPVTLDDDELKTLDNVVKHWNVAKAADTPEWDVKTALAELARCGLQALQGDYSDEPRPPTHTVTPPAPTAPLDTSTDAE